MTKCALTPCTPFFDCMAGPDTPPNPSIPEYVPYCLNAFDDDSDGDVDLDDCADFFAAFDGGA